MTLKENDKARATLGLVIGMLICCVLPVLFLVGLGASFVIALQKPDLWLGIIVIVLGISILYLVVHKVASTVS